MSTISHSNTCPITPEGKGCTCGGFLYCNKQGCEERAIPRGKYCKGHQNRKECIKPDCTKLAREKGEFCIKHGGGRHCVELNCDKLAIGKTDYCKGHGGGKQCAELNCDKLARGKTGFCKRHGGGERCTELGCDKAARDRTKFCKGHGGGKRCAEPKCGRAAREGTDFCKGHGGGKRCAEPDCTKSAAGKTDYCVGHGGGKRCAEPDCTKSAAGKTDYCVGHGGGHRCPNCITWPDSRGGTSKYDGYCATCFKRLFPDDPRSTIIYEHTKEIHVRNAINQRFDGFIHDRPLYTGNCDCTHRRRIDHRKLIDGTILAIETDEFAHRDYDKKDEEIRYHDLFMIDSCKWIFIRFNPDKTKTCDTDIEDRIEVLLNEIEKQIDRITKGENTEPLEIYPLFYA